MDFMKVILIIVALFVGILAFSYDKTLPNPDIFTPIGVTGFSWMFLGALYFIWHLVSSARRK